MRGAFRRAVLGSQDVLCTAGIRAAADIQTTKQRIQILSEVARLFLSPHVVQMKRLSDPARESRMIGLTLDAM